MTLALSLSTRLARWWAAASLVLAAGLFVAGTARADDARESALRHVAGILDYVGADYAGAVSPAHEITNQLEFDEQLSLLAEAKTLLGQAALPENDPVRTGLARLEGAMRQKAAPADVLALCRQIRTALVRDHHVSLAPAQAPDLERGAALYQSSGCIGCHGVDGRADTPAAQQYTPRPANFTDRERMGGVSPHRAFHALTFGVSGTQMRAYDTLSAGDRWNLAFYVMTMRYRGVDAVRGETVVKHAGRAVDDGFEALAVVSDDELREAMARAVPDDAQRELALAWLRTRAPFTEAAAGMFALARTRIDDGERAYAAGDHDRAKAALLSAYLDGIEPHEPALRARNEVLVKDIERAMLDLRGAVTRGAPSAEVTAKAARARALLASAEVRRDDGNHASSAFFGAFAIALREGLEAALLIAALLGLTRKRGKPEHAKVVHAGWLAAVPTGLLTWLLAGHVISGLQRELAEGIVSLLAAVVLLGVTHWILGQISSRKLFGLLTKSLASDASGKNAAWGLFSLAFIAAYREAFEIVLFFQALLLEAREAASSVWLGAAAGLGVLVATVLVIKRIGQKLDIRPFMIASSVLLAVLAVTIVGKGVHSLQEAGVVSFSAIAVPEISWFGVYPTIETLAAQGVLVLLLAGSAVGPWLAARKAKAESAASESAVRAP